MGDPGQDAGIARSASEPGHCCEIGSLRVFPATDISCHRIPAFKQ
jgi:hypothetical protein